MPDLVKIAERRMNKLRDRRREFLNALYEADDNVMSETSTKQAVEDEDALDNALDELLAVHTEYLAALAEWEKLCEDKPRSLTSGA